jgi:hypothetical protein
MLKTGGGRLVSLRLVRGGYGCVVGQCYELRYGFLRLNKTQPNLSSARHTEVTAISKVWPHFRPLWHQPYWLGA